MWAAVPTRWLNKGASMFRRESKPQNRIDSLIGATTRIEGNVFFSGGLRVDGAVRGNVAALPDQPFLGRRGHKLAGPRKQRAAAEGASAPRGWAVLGVQQPVIGPETSMKPDGMVEACEHQPGIEDEAAVSDQRRVEQREVRGIGQHHEEVGQPHRRRW